MLKKLPLLILGLWVLLAIISPFLNLDSSSIHLDRILHPPGQGSLFGNDDLGRSVAHRLIEGSRVSFVVAILVVPLSAMLGTFIGLISGFAGGRWDQLWVNIMDVFLAFPGILLAIALAGLLGPGIENVVLALTVVGWVGYARLTRAQVLTVKTRDHVLAARSLGVFPGRIMFRHILPIVSAPLLVEISFSVASVVVAEAGLSFLGLGVQPPDASWGSMIRDGSRYLLVAPHLVIIPGISLMLVVLAVNILGDQMRDRMHVRTRMG